MKIRNLFIYLLITCTFLSCSNDGEFVPYVPVNIQINLLDPQFSNLNAVGGWVYITGGSKGIILFRTDTDEFRASDRHCTYNVDDQCQVEMETNNVTSKDDCCESQFDMFGGTVFSGPANIPLKEYRTTYDGTSVRIFN